VANRYHKEKLLDIANRYGLHLHRIKSYNSLYKKNAAYRASTNKGEFLIKEFNIRSNGTNMTKEQQSRRTSLFIQKLKKCKYPNIANWMTTKSERYFVNKNGKKYYMTEWIEGRSLQNKVQDYDALGKALAILHTSCKDSLPSMSSFTKKQIGLFKFHDRLFRLRLMNIRRGKMIAKRWFHKYGGHCNILANEAWNIIATPEVQHIISDEINHPALIHGDVTLPNIIIDSNGLYLIDWDCIRMGSIYYEIAKTLSNTTFYNPVHIHALLRGYEEIKSLKSAERLLISALFRLPREAWGVARNIQLGKGPHGLRVLEQTWDERLKAIRSMDDWARQLPTVVDVLSK
jgi:Ser/Thr protein kinase RdoA (MazF antagonist)